MEYEIIKRCQRGDREAFRWLVDRYGDLAYRAAYFMIYDRQLAEDVTQESFLDAWRGIHGFDIERPFKPWFLKIVLNRCRMQIRRARRLPVRLEEMDRKERATLDSHPTDEATALWESHQRIGEAIVSLKEDQRSVVMLHYFAELTLSEIAQVLSLPEGTVKSRLHRALEHLRQRLTAAMEG